MRTLVLVISVLFVLVGGLWLLQGLGAVQVAPILCVADCEPLQGPSLPWTVLGAAVAVAGVSGIVRSVKPARHISRVRVLERLSGSGTNDSRERPPAAR